MYSLIQLDDLILYCAKNYESTITFNVKGPFNMTNNLDGISMRLFSEITHKDYSGIIWVLLSSGLPGTSLNNNAQMDKPDPSLKASIIMLLMSPSNIL